MTLGKNADAVLLKSQKMLKTNPDTATTRKPVKDGFSFRICGFRMLSPRFWPCFGLKRLFWVRFRRTGT